MVQIVFGAAAGLLVAGAAAAVAFVAVAREVEALGIDLDG